MLYLDSSLRLQQAGKLALPCTFDNAPASPSSNARTFVAGCRKICPRPRLKKPALSSAGRWAIPPAGSVPVSSSRTIHGAFAWSTCRPREPRRQRHLGNAGIGLDQVSTPKGGQASDQKIRQRRFEPAEDRGLRSPYLISDIAWQLGEIELSLSRPRLASFVVALELPFDAWTLDGRLRRTTGAGEVLTAPPPHNGR